MKKLIPFCIALMSFADCFAQDNNRKVEINAGIGLGIDYGGFGGRITVSPIEQVFAFGALGYNIDGLGYNAGGGFRFSPGKRFSPYAIGMYGYNSLVILLENDEYQPAYTKAFNGASVGLGFEQRRIVGSKNFFNFELLYPLRSQSFKDYKSLLERTRNAKFVSLPFAFSVGYHIGF